MTILFACFLFSTPLFAEKIAWLTNYDQAVSAARKSSKPIFVDCFADWCVWCHRLEEEVYNDPEFEAWMDRYVPLRINVEDQDEGTKLARTYNVDSLPTMLVIDADGNLLNRTGGFLPAKELMEDITLVQKLVHVERLNPTDWETIQTLAEEYLIRDMNSQAETRFKRLLDSPSVSDQQKETIYFSLALALYYQKKLTEAQEFMNQYIKTFKDGKSLEDILLLQSQIDLEMDKKDDAKQLLQELLARFPESHNRSRIEATLDLLAEH